MRWSIPEHNSLYGSIKLLKKASPHPKGQANHKPVYQIFLSLPSYNKFFQGRPSIPLTHVLFQVNIKSMLAKVNSCAVVGLEGRGMWLRSEEISLNHY